MTGWQGNEKSTHEDGPTGRSFLQMPPRTESPISSPRSPLRRLLGQAAWGHPMRGSALIVTFCSPCGSLCPLMEDSMTGFAYAKWPSLSQTAREKIHPLAYLHWVFLLEKAIDHGENGPPPCLHNWTTFKASGSITWRRTPSSRSIFSLDSDFRITEIWVNVIVFSLPMSQCHRRQCWWGSWVDACSSRCARKQRCFPEEGVQP